MNAERLNELAAELQKEINRYINNHVILGTYMNPEAAEMLCKAKKLIETAAQTHGDEAKYQLFD